MIIEDLIRTGRLLILGGLKPELLLRLISDVTSNQVRNFFQHVFVVELPDQLSGADPVALPMQVWGQPVQPDPKKKKTVFEPDIDKAVGAPFVFPGGNPIHPQGTYGVPVFPVFEKHLLSFKSGVESVRSFLEGRLKRCPSLSPSDDLLDGIAEQLFRQLQTDDPQSAGKTLALIVLADANGQDAPYQYADRQSVHAIGKSKLQEGKHIVPNFDRIQSLYTKSKVTEGGEMGARAGRCSVCGDGDEVNLVSIYCKSWPWFLPTWTCPVSNAGNKKSIVEGIALDEKCYEALSVGSSYFAKLAAPVDSIVTRELFSPVADREGQRTVQHKSVSDLTTIYGAILLLPIIELEQIEDEEREEFGERLRLRLARSEAAGRLEQHVNRVIGFNAAVPREVDDSIYRLTLIYYSGDPSRGDIHLRCVIEDVIPSVLYKLVKLAQRVAEDVSSLCEQVLPGCSEKRQAYHAVRFRFIPFILARAYGGPYVWEQLQRVLRREPLNVDRPTANAVHRIASLMNQLPKTEYDIREEVLFLLTFYNFAGHFNENIAIGEQKQMSMRQWKELLDVVERSPIEQLEFESLGEIGFACGVLIRRFGRWYAGELGKGKDFLRDRILTFGSTLGPKEIWHNGMLGIRNVAGRYVKLYRNVEFGQLGYYSKDERTNHQGDFAKRFGVVLSELERNAHQLNTARDEFMSGFWTGYSVQGHGFPKKSED